MKTSRSGARDLPEEPVQPEDAASAVPAPLRALAQRRGGPVAARWGLPQRPPPAAVPALACLRLRGLRASPVPRFPQAGRAQDRATPGPPLRAAAPPAAGPWPRRGPGRGPQGPRQRSAGSELRGPGEGALSGVGGGGAQDLRPPWLLAGRPPAPLWGPIKATLLQMRPLQRVRVHAVHKPQASCTLGPKTLLLLAESLHPNGLPSTPHAPTPLLGPVLAGTQGSRNGSACRKGR